MMRELIKVEGVSGIYKDPSKNTFINMNESEIRQARMRKKNRLKKKEEEIEMKNRIDSMEEDISDIKSMLQQLLEK